jgi:hypothetical protein
VNESSRFRRPEVGIRLSVTEDALTPYGGLVPWAAYTKHIGIAENLAASFLAQRTSPNAAPVYDILQSFMLTALPDGRRLSHIERLWEDPTIPELFGMEAVVSDDAVRRFFMSIPPEMGAEWIARNAKPMWAALPDRIIMDWDSTVGLARASASSSAVSVQAEVDEPRAQRASLRP